MSCWPLLVASHVSSFMLIESKSSNRTLFIQNWSSFLCSIKLSKLDCKLVKINFEILVTSPLIFFTIVFIDWFYQTISEIVSLLLPKIKWVEMLAREFMLILTWFAFMTNFRFKYKFKHEYSCILHILVRNSKRASILFEKKFIMWFVHSHTIIKTHKKATVSPTTKEEFTK